MPRIGFILRSESPEAERLLEQLAPPLVEAGHHIIVSKERGFTPKDAKEVAEAGFAESSDLVVVLGGDGTMLRAAGLVADSGVPVLGVNLGRLGFLTQFDSDSALKAIRDAVAGKLPRTERMRLHVTYRPDGGKPIEIGAVNDAIIHQGAMARLVELDTYLDHKFIARYRADGLIVATPTGSTAYNLAAGGPIMVPGHKTMVVTPICAHALTNRPLVVEGQETISVSVGPDSRGVVITLDGLWAHTFKPGDRVEITANQKPLITFDSGKPYFDILREKLHWGAFVARTPRT